MKVYMAPMEGLTDYMFRNAYDKFFGHNKIDKYFMPFISPNKSEKFLAKEMRDISRDNNHINSIPQVMTNNSSDFIWTAHMLYDEFGYYCNTVQSYTFEGASGMEKMAAIMDGLRVNKPSSFAGYEVTKIDDYKTSKSTDVKTGEESEITLPKSNVLAYTLTDGNKVIVRPSGTEPKIKAYITAIGTSEENAKQIAQELLKDADELMK